MCTTHAHSIVIRLAIFKLNMGVIKLTVGGLRLSNYLKAALVNRH